MNLTWLKDIVAPCRVIDPLFGPIRFLHSSSVWEGKLYFEPVANNVEIMLTGSRSGVTERQRQWFMLIKDQFEILWCRMEPLIIEAAERYDGTPPEKFHLVSISLSAMAGDRPAWEMTFQRTSTGRQYDVELQGWAVTKVHPEL